MFLLRKCRWARRYQHVANYNNSTVEKFDSSGNGPIFVISGLGFPIGIALDSSGNVYVSNQFGPLDGVPQVTKYDSSGNGSVFVNSLIDPYGLAFDSSGNLYVANSGNNTIEKFANSG
jgi:sugar lactone lactonase YvrE